MNSTRENKFLPITLICVIALLLSYVNEVFSIFLCIVIGFWLIWRARMDGLIGLIILYVIKYNFYRVLNFKSMEGLGEVERESISIAGFPLNLPTLACLFISLKVIIEWFYSPSTFDKKFPKILFYLWLAAFIPATISFFYSYIMHFPNWTRGYRFLMISGSFFYGFILAKKWSPLNDKALRLYFIPFLFVVLFFLNAHYFWSHLAFLLLALSCALSIYLLISRNPLNVITGLIMLTLSSIIIINSTITVLLIGFLSFFFSFLSNNRIGRILPKHTVAIKYIGYMIIVLSLLFPFIIIQIAQSSGLDMSFYDSDFNASFYDRIFAKAFLDRLPLWLSALNQIISGPFIIVTSGRPLIVEGLTGEYEWEVGAHNVILEVLRNTGILVGPTIILIYLYALYSNFKILIKSNNNLIKSFASAIIGVGIAGILTGDFPAEMTVGIFIWSLAGFFYDLHLKSKNAAKALPTLEYGIEK